jgi:hypothetical protein
MKKKKKKSGQFFLKRKKLNFPIVRGLKKLFPLPIE